MAIVNISVKKKKKSVSRSNSLKNTFSKTLRLELLKAKKEKKLDNYNIAVLTGLREVEIINFLRHKGVLSYDRGKFIEEFLIKNNYLK